MISTHVLDTELGEPAAGMKVGLYRGKELVSLQETDENGRIAELAESLEPGKRADVAVWRTDGLELGGADDVVAGFVLSAPHRVDRLYVGGVEVVRDGYLVRADEDEIARHHRAQARRFAA